VQNTSLKQQTRQKHKPENKIKAMCQLGKKEMIAKQMSKHGEKEQRKRKKKKKVT